MQLDVNGKYSRFIMKKITFTLLLFLLCTAGRAQSDFIGIIRYKLFVAGSANPNTDSMTVIFDKYRVKVILYLPDSNKVLEKVFIDDIAEKKSYRVDPQNRSFEVDTLKLSHGPAFVNTNSIGAVNRDLCIRYSADMKDADITHTRAIECLAGIDYRNSFIDYYSFFGVQPLIVDNRLVLELVTTSADGSKPTVTATSIQKLSNVDPFFDLWGYREINNIPQ